MRGRRLVEGRQRRIRLDKSERKRQGESVTWLKVQFPSLQCMHTLHD